MRKILLAFLLLAGITGMAQENGKQKKNSRKVTGSGNIVTREVAVQPFEELKVSGVFSVSLVQGDKEQVRIEADDNLQELFEVRNEGSKLVIDMKDDVNINSKKGFKVFISFRNLRKMDLGTVGNVSSEKNLSFRSLDLRSNSVGNIDLNLTADAIDLNNTSVGTVRLTGKADRAVIKNNGVGSLKASDFVVQTMEIDNSGVGSAEVNAEKELKVKDSFLGKVKNKGKAEVKKKVTI